MPNYVFLVRSRRGKTWIGLVSLVDHTSGQAIIEAASWGFTSEKEGNFIFKENKTLFMKIACKLHKLLVKLCCISYLQFSHDKVAAFDDSSLSSKLSI